MAQNTHIQMDAVSFNLHQFGDHVLLEVITDGGNGNVTANSIEFAIEDADSGLLMPLDELPSGYCEDVHELLESEGYSLVEGQLA